MRNSWTILKCGAGEGWRRSRRSWEKWSTAMSQGGEKYPTKSKKKEGLLDSSYLTQELSFKAYYW